MYTKGGLVSALFTTTMRAGETIQTTDLLGQAPQSFVTYIVQEKYLIP